jgi:Flp pilus assembly protein TadD
MRSGWVAALVLCLGGCTSTVDERVDFYNQDGVQLFQAGNYQNAYQDFRLALSLKPDDLNLRFNLAQCYDHLGDTKDAETLYRQCLTVVPNHAPSDHALAELLVRTGRETEAEQLIHNWMAREPKRATPYAEEAWLLRQQGNLPLAQARLQQALELDPHDIRALTELAQVYEQSDRPDRALVLYERILYVDPTNTDIAHRLDALKAKGIHEPHPD